MKRMVDFAAMVLLSLPAIALGQTHASDVGIEEYKVRLGAPEYSPFRRHHGGLARGYN